VKFNGRLESGAGILADRVDFHALCHLKKIFASKCLAMAIGGII
jgi:hypothetical protein